MKKLWETGILLFAVMGFWGMIYPDLCFISDVCHVRYDAHAPLEGEGCGEMQDGDGTSDADCAGTADGTAGTADRSVQGMGLGNGTDGWQPDIYTRICEAQPEQIKVKSKLVEWFRK